MKLSGVRRPAFEKHTQWADGPPTRILFVRHGETDWNVRRIIQGWKGSGLNAVGLRQARLAAARVKGMDLGLSALLCSDLLRARQTGAFLARGLGLPLRRRVDLRERCFGAWEGQSIEQVLQRFKLGAKVRKDPFLAFDPEGGESMDVFARRVRGFMDRVLKEYPGRSVAAVTHGGPVRIAACLAAGIPPKRYFLLGRPGNVSLTLLAHQGGVWWIELYNDMGHLELRRAASGPAGRRP
jgi:probable phosphoglycerate mutase